MKIILSPAKKMIIDTDSIAPVGMPDFLDKTIEILSWMKGLEKDKLKAIWKCNDKITTENIERIKMSRFLSEIKTDAVKGSFWNTVTIEPNKTSVTE